MNRSEFLRRLIGIAGIGFFSIPEIKATQKVYLLQTFVAGFRFYKSMELLQHMQQNDIVELKRIPENEHDAFAIALYWQQEMIGYLPAETNEVLARLMDAKALSLIGLITHLNHDAKPWENVAVAVYFLQPENKELPKYLTQIEAPVYSSINKKKATPANKPLPDVLEYDERVIAIDDVPDEAAKAYYNRYYSKYSMHINNKTYLRVPDDGIYTYMYNVQEKGWVENSMGEKFLEFEYSTNPVL